MSSKTKDKPYCYGKLDSVFPMGSDGLRNTPESCFPCRLKTECLRAAVSGKDGIKIRSEMIDRAYASGKTSFLERWSRRKALHQQKRELKKKK